MSKKTSIVVIGIILAITLALGVFSCLPGGLEYGDYNIYNAPINLIQGSSLFTDSVKATYKVKLNDEANINDVAASIRTRLARTYGYYFSNVKVDGDIITVQVPVTAREDQPSETSVLSAVTAQGKVELVTSTTYSADSVVLSSEHLANPTTRRFANGSDSYYIVNVKLTKEGREIAAKKLASTSTVYLAVDGTVAYGVAYNANNGTLQIYTNSDAQSASVAGLVKGGALNATLTALDTENVSSCGGLVFALVFAAIVIGSWVFYLVRYGKVAIGAMLSQLIAIVLFIICAGTFKGIACFKILNIVSAIGIVLGYCFMSASACYTLCKIRGYVGEKTFASAKYRAFHETTKWQLIAHACLLIVGIVLWLIHTGITAPLGNALVYAVVLSVLATFALNRLFVSLVAPLCESK